MSTSPRCTAGCLLLNTSSSYMRIFVALLRSFELHIFYSGYHVPYAIPILLSTSSNPSCMLMFPPRYTKFSVCSCSCPFTSRWNFLLPAPCMFSFIPIFRLVCATPVSAFCNPSVCSASSAVSSNLVSPIFSPLMPPHLPHPKPWPWSKNMLNSKGDKNRTPVVLPSPFQTSPIVLHLSKQR